MNPKLTELAERTVGYASKAGASEVAVEIECQRLILIKYREGKLERLQESVSSFLDLALYIDGRYSTHRTSDMRWKAIKRFVDYAVPMTRLLNADPHRGLADPKFYKDRPTDDLDLWDQGYAEVGMPRRKQLAAAVERGARSVGGPIISITASYHDRSCESVKVHSNGFAGSRQDTSFRMDADVSVSDAGGRKPEAWHWARARHHKSLPDPETVGKKAAQRALARRGQKKLPTGKMTIVLENRSTSRLVQYFVRALYGSALQQERSFLIGRRDETVGSPLFHLVDDPLLPGGFGSRHYDCDGISVRKRVLVENGVLRQYLIDVYYGRKLEQSPNGGSVSNLLLSPCEKSRSELIAGVSKGVYVTDLLGGNSDTTTGDLSHGLVGFAIENGQLADPIGEMNISGNHAELWKKLVDVGNDPYPYSALRLPTLVFEDVSISGA